jgi:hypothetical protein
MHSIQYRSLILIGLLAASAWLMSAFDRPNKASVARWPTEDAVYAVDGWTSGHLAVESAHGVTIVSRNYRRADGTTASLAISTSPEAKRIYRAGAAVPFLGSGYTVDSAPPSLVPPVDGRTALFVQREGALGLLIYGYGERRGLLGNGVEGWGAVVLDGVSGRSNDYYLTRIFVPLDELDSSAVPAALALAETLMPRLAAWYGS